MKLTEEDKDTNRRPLFAQDDIPPESDEILQAISDGDDLGENTWARQKESGAPGRSVESALPWDTDDEPMPGFANDPYPEESLRDCRPRSGLIRTLLSPSGRNMLMGVGAVICLLTSALLVGYWMFYPKSPADGERQAPRVVVVVPENETATPAPEPASLVSEPAPAATEPTAATVEPERLVVTDLNGNSHEDRVIPMYEASLKADLSDPSGTEAPAAALTEKTPEPAAAATEPAVAATEPSAAEKAAVPDAKRIWAINVLSTTKEAEQKRVLDALKGSAYTVYTYLTEVNGQQWHRIRVGFFESRQAAEEAGKALAKEHKLPDPWVVRPSTRELAQYQTARATN